MYRRLLITFLISTLPLTSVATESLSYSGRLVNANGSPVIGPVHLKFDLAYTDDLSTILCTHEKTGVDLINGVFHTKLNFVCPSSNLKQVLEEIPTNNTIAIRVTDLTQSPSKIYSFQAINSVPHSIMSETAKQLVQMEAKNGQVLTWSNSGWVPSDPASTTQGTVTSLTATDGLYGGTITESGIIGLADGGVTANKLHQMGASAGQVLKWNGSVWVPASDDNTLPASETDPYTLAFARNDIGGITPEVCEVNQALHFVAVDFSLRCFDIVENTIDSAKDKTAPSQKAVSDALAEKQDKLTSSSEVTLKSLRLTSDGDSWVGLKAPNTAGDFYLTLPAGPGGIGQVLKSDGAGNLSWMTPSTNSSDIVDGSIVDADISGSANIDQSKIAGLPAALTAIQNSITNLTTDNVSEGSRLYFTEEKVLGTDLAGLNTTNGVITYEDTVLSAIGKLVGNLGVVTSDQSNYVLKSGDIMSGNLQMGGYHVTGLGVPSDDTDAATKKYVDEATAAASSKWSTNANGIHYTNNVGIGTTTPTLKLVVDTGGTAAPYSVGTDKLAVIGAGNSVIQVTTSNTGQGAIYFSDPESRDPGGVAYSHSTDSLSFRVNNANRMFIDSSGNVGIGKSSPTKKLDVAGDIQVSAGSDVCIDGGKCLSSVGATQADSSSDGFLSAADWETFNNKQDAITQGNTSQYLRGDLSLSTFASDVTGTVLTGFSSGPDALVTNSDSVEVAIEKLQGQVTANKALIPTVPLSTDQLGEGILNRYFTEARAIESPLTGLSTATSSDVTASDSILTAIGKLQAQMNFADSDRTNYVLKSGDSMSGSLGIGGTANASAMLDIQSTTKGFLPPRMTQAQRDAIASPVTGLVIFNTTSGQIEYFSGGGWTNSNSFIGARVVRSSAQSGTYSSDIKIDMLSKSFDVGNTFDLATDRFKPTVAGKYLVTLQIHASAQAAGAHNISLIKKNGATYESRFTRSTYSGNSHSNVVTLVDLNGTTDYVEPFFNISDGHVDSAVFTASLQAPAASTAGGGGALSTDSVDGSHIQTGAVSSLEIADGTITSADIAPNGISLSNLDFASNQGINIPQQASNPASGVMGQTYYNTTNKRLMVYDGAGWVEIIGGVDGHSLDSADGSKVDALFVNNSGHVGIGTTSPAAKLHVNAGTIEVSNSSARKNRYAFHYDQGGDTTIYYHHLGHISYNDGDMHISGSLSGHDSLTQGKSIIDIFVNARNAPYINGVIYGDPINSDIEVYEDAGGNLEVYLKTGTYSQINFDIAVTGLATSYLVDSTKTSTVPTGTLVAKASSHAKLFVRNSGNVGIGVENPSQKLEVAGTVKATNFQGTLNGFKMAAGSFGWSVGACGNSAGSPCNIDISSGNFTTAPICTITMKNIDGTDYTEKMVIKGITTTTLSIWRGKFPDAGTTMQGFWTCMGQ